MVWCSLRRAVGMLLRNAVDDELFEFNISTVFSKKLNAESYSYD